MYFVSLLSLGEYQSSLSGCWSSLCTEKSILIKTFKIFANSTFCICTVLYHCSSYYCLNCENLDKQANSLIKTIFFIFGVRKRQLYDNGFLQVGCKALVSAARHKTSDYYGMLCEIAPQLQDSRPGWLHSDQYVKFYWIYTYMMMLNTFARRKTLENVFAVPCNVNIS